MTNLEAIIAQVKSCDAFSPQRKSGIIRCLKQVSIDPKVHPNNLLDISNTHVPSGFYFLWNTTRQGHYYWDEVNDVFITYTLSKIF